LRTCSSRFSWFCSYTYSRRRREIISFVFTRVSSILSIYDRIFLRSTLQASIWLSMEPTLSIMVKYSSFSSL
jgi:hypothetical protein